MAPLPSSRTPKLFPPGRLRHDKTMAATVRPPGPKSSSLVFGSLPEFRKDPTGFLLDAARTYGDLAYFRMGNQHMYLVSDPEAIRDILITHQSNFAKSRMLERAKVLLGEGLLTSESEFHTRQRRLVQPAFHRERLIRYAGDMVECAAKAREGWHSGSQVDIAEAMLHLTLAIVGRPLFSADVTAEAKEIGSAMTDILALFDTMMVPFFNLVQKLPIPPVLRFQRARERLDQIVYRMIAERRASGEDKGDLLSMLLLAQDEERQSGESGRMTDKQVRDEALTLLIAGHETTANALAWTWYLLAQNPEAEAKLHAELNEVLGGRLPTFDDLPRLPYTTGVFSETLRLYSPAWTLGRRAITHYEIGGYTIPANSILLLSQWVVHRDPRWFREPERFDPERWKPEAYEARPKFSYFPFGGGTRVCIGERFAWAEGILVLATIAQRWKMRLAQGAAVDKRAVMTLRVRNGMPMVLEKR
ncbi:MAG: cytochrome P450 [Bryobacteraceae bacterium]